MGHDPGAPGAILVELDPGKTGPDHAIHLASLEKIYPDTVLLVQLSPPGPGEMEAELAAVLPFAPCAVVLPEVSSGADIAQLATKLAVAEAEYGLPDGAVRIIACPGDRAAGLLKLGTLAGASARLAGLLWRPERLAADLGAAPDSPVLDHARTMILLAARAAGIPAFAGPSPGCCEGDAVMADCVAARRDGFAGRIAASPAELAAVRAVFGAPDDESRMPRSL